MLTYIYPGGELYRSSQNIYNTYSILATIKVHKCFNCESSTKSSCIKNADAFQEGVMEFSLEEITYTLSDALDLVGNQDYHGKRVAYIAVEIGRAMGWEDNTLQDLAMAGILHDCGLSSTRKFKKVVTELDSADHHEHAHRGWLLLSGFYPFSHIAPLVLHHHTRWDAYPNIDIPNDMTAPLANCLFLADRIEVAFSRKPWLTILSCVADIQQVASQNCGTLFSPELVDAFLKISHKEAFWLYLEPRYLEGRLSRLYQQRTQLLDLPQVVQLAKLFAHVVDTKSTFTAAHSVGVAHLAAHLGRLRGLPEKQISYLTIAGYLHDVGKLRADEILDKPGGLTEQEISVIRRHTFDTYQILNGIKGFWGISEWAAFHHERLDGSGYPFRIVSPLISLEACIISVADIFQALVQHRPYRKSMPPEQAYKILQGLVRDNALNAKLVDLLGEDLPLAFDIATIKN